MDGAANINELESTNSSLRIVWRGKEDPVTYERARVNRVFNCRRPPKYPCAIAFPKTEAEIVNVINLAIDRKFRVSIRAGGHSWPVWSLYDDSIIVVDLGNWSEMELDENTGILYVSPSTRGKDMVEYLLKRGRFFPVGHCPDVGIGGFLLCGGMGLNSNNWGWACQQILAVDFVTAKGDLVHANNDQNSEILWATRGAGPGFPGLITRFYLQTRPSPKFMRSSLYIYRMSRYEVAFSWALKIPSGVDDGLEVAVIGAYPFDMDEPCITISILAIGDTAEGARAALQRADYLHPDGTILRNFCEETSWSDQFDAKTRAFPEGHRYCVDNSFVDNKADLVAILKRAFTTLPTRQSQVLYNSWIPTSRRNLHSMALSIQSDHYFAVYAIWKEENCDHHNQAWVSNVMNEINQNSVGAYIGESDFRTQRLQFWGDEQRAQLMNIREEWDPKGLFGGLLGLQDNVIT